MLQPNKFVGYFFVATLISTVFFWDQSKTGKESTSPSPGSKIVKFDKASLRSIDFQNTAPTDNYRVDTSDKIKLVFNVQDGKWSIDQPIQAPADQTVIRRLVDQTLNLSFKNSFETDTTQWSQFGLDRPRRIIEFYTADNKTHQILVGDNTGVGNQLYIAGTDHQKIYSTSQAYMIDSDRSLFDFRSKEITNFDYERIQTFDFKATTPIEFSIQKNNDIFGFVDKRHKRLDQVFFGTFLAKLNRMQAQGFSLDENTLRKFDESLATYEIIFSTKTAALTQLKYAIVDNKLWVRVNNQKELRQLRQTDKNILRVELSELQDKSILNLEGIEIGSIEIDNKKINSDSKMDPNKKAAQQDFLKRLKDLQALTIIDDASVEKKLTELSPLHTVRLFQNSQQKTPTSEIMMWNLGGKNIVKTKSSTETFEVSKKFAKSLSDLKKSL